MPRGHAVTGVSSRFKPGCILPAVSPGHPAVLPWLILVLSSGVKDPIMPLHEVLLRKDEQNGRTSKERSSGMRKDL